jgi:hypothetical protein
MQFSSRCNVLVGVNPTLVSPGAICSPGLAEILDPTECSRSVVSDG